jgi:NADH-quinone oxidoreductase subunit L
VFWAIGVVAAACTSFYMVRLTVLTFFGTSRVDHHTAEHLHESPLSMTVPLIVLALLAIVGGYVSVPHAIGHLFGHDGDNLITQWLKPVIAQAKTTMEAAHPGHGSTALEWGLMATSTAIMLIMSGFAISLYKKGPEGGSALAKASGGFYNLVLDKWRIDELYQAVVVEPLKKLGDVFFNAGDRAVIEGVVNEGPRGVYLVTTVMSDIQTGLLRNYLKVIFLGLLVLGAWIIW